MPRLLRRFSWLALGLLLVPLPLAAQQLPQRFQGKKLIAVPPAGYEFPLELVEFRPWLEGSALKGIRITCRLKRLQHDFSVKEIFLRDVRLNGNPADSLPYSTPFSTKSPPTTELPPLEFQLPPDLPTAEALRTASELHVQAEAYVLISPSMLEIVRLGATQVVLHFPIVAAIPRAAVTEGEHKLRALELAKYYSPVIFQQTNDARKDFITKFNYDGNWRGDDNADNIDKFPLKAYVYYSVVESKAHYFLGYYFFHPDDYTKMTGPACGFFNRVGRHENDLEGIQLVVEKDGTPYGSLLAMETIAHIWFHQLENSDRVKDKREVPEVLEDIDGHIELETNQDGVHPKVYVECLGHGVWGYGHNGKELKPGTKHVVYRVGEQAEEPEGPNDHDVRYELIDVFDLQEGLWNHRDKFADALPERPFSNPETFWDGFVYTQQMGSAFYSDDGAHARPPWGWQAKGTRRGDWVMAPAFAFSRHLAIPGLSGENLTYVSNAFLKPGGGNPGIPPPELDQQGEGPEGAEGPQTPPATPQPTSQPGTSEPKPPQGTPEPKPPPAPASTTDSGAAPQATAPAKFGLTEVTQLLLDKRSALASVDSLDALLKTGREILLPLVSGYLNLSGSDASRFTFRYKSVLGLKSVRLYWKTDKMQDFDEEHSVQLHLSTKPGWHWQTVEMMELESFDRLATITQVKVNLEFDKESFDWRTSPQELLEMLKNLPQAVDFFFGRSGYLKQLEAAPAKPSPTQEP